MNLKPLLNTAIEASLLGGKEIIKVYGTEFSVEVKEDKSPLTLADKNAHTVIARHLASTKLPVLSEEGKEIPYEIRSRWEYFWMIDPLDGTKEFIKRNGEFTVNIALIHQGKAILGVIYVPVSSNLYYGTAGSGAYRVEGVRENAALENIFEEAVKLPESKQDEKYTVVCSRSHMSQETEAFIEELRLQHPEINFASKGSSLKLCLIAEGRANIYPRFAPTMEWDTAAGQAIVEASGGSVIQAKTTDPVRYNKEDLLNPWFIARLKP